MKKSYIVPVLLLLIFLLTSCSGDDNQTNKTGIAVTNSYLQCIVDELCGGEVDVFSLAPPGMCPGHFDITPAQLRQLRNCGLLLLFDFQSLLESSLAGLKKRGLETAIVVPLPGMCIPDTYLDTCRQVCDILCLQFPENQDYYRQKLSGIESRLDSLAQQLRMQLENAGLSNAKVLASGHQSVFADWLGLDTIAVFAGSDAETASNINDCIQKAQGQDVKFIIANQQEGTSLADILAQRLDAQMVVFSNFPVFEKGTTGFDNLVKANISGLTGAEQ